MAIFVPRGIIPASEQIQRLIDSESFVDACGGIQIFYTGRDLSFEEKFEKERMVTTLVDRIIEKIDLQQEEGDNYSVDTFIQVGNILPRMSAPQIRDCDDHAYRLFHKILQYSLPENLDGDFTLFYSTLIQIDDEKTRTQIDNEFQSALTDVRREIEEQVEGG